MAFFPQLMAKLKRVPQDIVGIDFEPTGVNCVRARKTNSTISIVAVDQLPAVNFSADSTGVFNLPKPLVSRYVSICVPGDQAIVKLLNLPGQLEGDVEAQIKEHMGVEAGEYRIGYRGVSQGHGRTETKLLTVAVPEAEAQAACAVFASGWPAPISVELSGLAALTAFLQGPARAYKEQAISVIELGARVTLVAFINKGELVLIRKFDSGYLDLLDRIQQSLSVDAETAENIVADGSFDISQLVKDVSEPLIKQWVISKHFIERRENCQIAKLYVPGGKRISRDWVNEVKSAMSLDIEVWNPFESVPVLPAAIPQPFEEQGAMFSAALGAVLGTFETLTEG